MSDFEYPRDFKGVWIPKEVWLDDNLTATDKIILVEIYSLDIDGTDGCYASNEYLAKFCQCSIRKVTESVAKLKELGYIVQTKSDGRKRWLKASLEKNTSETSKKCYSEKQNLRESNIDSNIKENIYKYASFSEENKVNEDSDIENLVVKCNHDKIIDDEETSATAKEIEQIILYFQKKYKHSFGREHPSISYKALERIVDNYIHPEGKILEYGIYDFAAYKEMIDRYFEVNYNVKGNFDGKVNLSLSHFMSDAIREYLVYKAGLI